MMKKYLGTAAAAAMLALAGSGTAEAAPVYAYAALNFQNLTLTGVVDASGAPLAGVSGLTTSVTSTDGANYPGAPSNGFSAGGNLSTGSDPSEATSGPGPFPGQNVFAQAFLPANVPSPAGTRGDALITGALASGATFNLVAEGKLSTSSNAGSNSGTSTTIQATFVNQDTINLTFAASSSLASQVALVGDSAGAQTSTTFKVFNVTTGTFVNITDNINAANSGTTIAPFFLNRSVATTDPAGPQNFSSPLTAYSFSANLLAGDTYQIILQDSTTTTLQGVPQSVSVPEPVSMTILGSGLIALGALRRRKA